MLMKRLYIAALMALLCVGDMLAANVKVYMNTTSKTMKLVSKATGTPVETGEPTGQNLYEFDVQAGTYILTAYASDGETVNGTIELNVTEEDGQEFKILTCTAYATNKEWKVDEDYTVEVEINSREGVRQNITVGNSTTAGRKTFLALNGNSYYASLIPSEAHQAEGHMTLYRAGTLTFGVTVSGVIPMGQDYTLTVPADADFYLGIKFAHFTAFKDVEPRKTEVEGDTKSITYRLADGQQYNYRTWKSGGLTQAGYFTMYIDESKRPALAFTNTDYEAFAPKTIKHDVQWNSGYETGDIFVNINERGHLQMNVGDTYEAHAMRTWQLTDNSTNNYFMEPDFHYTVIDMDGNPSTGVIEIDNANTTTDPWSVVKAVGKGTAIVLVTYDAIGLNYYSSANKNHYMGGEYWSAIWPENTAAYVVTVGEGEASVKPNMLINEGYNEDTKKNAGKYVDAEHDVFYYLDTEEGCSYSFAPEGVENVEMAYPVIGEQSATYKGFGTEGVTRNEDGSYTLLLKEGRQIVRMTDAAGNAAYQVLTAKSCHREITNQSREGSKIFQPGDKVKIQYSGLRHPANKLAGIYNMSAYVTYNGIPNGSSLILGSGQYTFGSAASAQAVTVDIPSDYDIEANPEIVMNEGVIQVNGYGDPIGNHRLISRTAGRSANFTAIAHKTYFGAIPDVRIPLTAIRNFDIYVNGNVEDAEYTIVAGTDTLLADSEGVYSGTYGTYSITGKKAGYRCYHGSFTIDDDAEGDQNVNVEMVALGNEEAWDGKTLAEPMAVDGVYQIGTGAEMAWFAANVNDGNNVANAVLTADIDLADYDWTPAGGSTMAKAYKGHFNGLGHTVSGLYINNAGAKYQGLFGFIADATIEGVTVEGEIVASQYAGGLAAYLGSNATVDRCVNKANVTAGVSYGGGITGYLSNATSKVTNSYNLGNIISANYCGGIAGGNNVNAVVENVFCIGELEGNNNVGACVGGSTAKNNMKNMFAVKEYAVTTSHTLVTYEQMASGEVAYLLGEAFGQEIGKNAHPVLGGAKVYGADGAYTNSNPAYDNIINFEDVALGDAGYWNGANGDGLFMTAGNYSFMNYYNENYKSWSGFAVSCTTDSVFTGYGTVSEFNSCVGGGMESMQFAVGYYSEYDFYMEDLAPAIYATKAFRPKYVHVNNAASAYVSMMNGDGIANKFTEEDSLVLTITGMTADDEETGHVDFYLAKDGKIVKEWTKVDLTSLGAVDHVRFTMKSSDMAYGFMNTPAYFCIDNMESELTDDVPTGISDIIDTDKRLPMDGIYTIDGMRVNSLQRGVNIVRMPDGTMRKVMIR